MVTQVALSLRGAGLRGPLPPRAEPGPGGGHRHRASGASLLVASTNAYLAGLHRLDRAGHGGAAAAAHPRDAGSHRRRPRPRTRRSASAATARSRSPWMDTRPHRARTCRSSTRTSSAGLFETLGTTMRQGAGHHRPGPGRLAGRHRRQPGLRGPLLQGTGSRWASGSSGAATPPWWSGVVATGKYQHLDEAARPFVYRALTQSWRPTLELFVRTTGEPVALAEPLRREFASLDAEPAVPRSADDGGPDRGGHHHPADRVADAGTLRRAGARCSRRSASTA